MLILILIGIISVLLMLFILIQNPKGGGIDSTLGGASANQMFGAANTADLLERLVWGLAAGLFVLALVSSFLIRNKTGVDSAPDQPRSGGGTSYYQQPASQPTDTYYLS